MNDSLVNKLTTFNNKTAHYLIIDVGYPLSNEFLENIKKAVQHVLCLESSSQSSSHIPCFGMSLINRNFQPVIKLTPVRGKCCKFLHALKSFSENMVQARGQLSSAEFKDFIHLALVSALENFQEYCRTMVCKDIDNPQISSQLQITIVTAKNGNEIQSNTEALVQNISINKLKKIQIIQLLDGSKGKKNTNKSLCNDFVELRKVNGSEEDLENIFKTWLINCNNEFIHVRIKLPGMMLKCDLVECLINVESLNCAAEPKLQADIQSYTVSDSEFCIYELEIKNRLSSDGLDESLLFGQPIGLIPTKCVMLNWSEIQYNKECFSGLCQSLANKQEYLIAEIQTSGKDKACGYFVLLPGPGMLLVKSIATKELLLPTPDAEIEEISESTLNEVSNCLSQVHKLDEYNPNIFNAGLYTALIQRFKKKEEFNNEASTSSIVKNSLPKKMKIDISEEKHSIVIKKCVKKIQIKTFNKS